MADLISFFFTSFAMGWPFCSDCMRLLHLFSRFGGATKVLERFYRIEIC